MGRICRKYTKTRKSDRVMLTDAQVIIIRTVCSYQFESLETILLQPDIEEDYTLILEAHGCTRKDLDRELIHTRKVFQEVWNKPELLFELSDLNMDVFKFILNHIQRDFVNIYPKALNNILNRLLIHQMMNNFENLN